MQSVIGPRDHLQDFNINVLADLPVGYNLQDHIVVPVLLTGEKITGPDPTTIEEFPLPTITGFVSLNKTNPRPDYQVLACPAARGSKYPLLLCHGFGLRDEICNRFDDAASLQETLLVNIILLHPESRGRVRLRANSQVPDIYMGYYDVKQDLVRHAEYVEDFLRVLNTTHCRSVQSKVVDLKLKGCQEITFGSREYWQCYAREIGSTLWHPAGSTAMGTTESSVLDSRLFVRNTLGLRVADASAVPGLTSGNINAPIALLAEQAARIIREDHGITC